MTLLQNGSNQLLLDPNGKIYMKGSILAVWNMDESSGSIMQDATAMDTDGTIGAGVTLNSGSYTFGRTSNSKVVIDSPINLSLSNFTFNCWVTPPTNAQYATTDNIILYLRDTNSSYRVHFGLLYQTSTLFNVVGTLYNGNAVAAAGGSVYYSTGSAYMATVTWDGSTIKAYCNASIQSITGTLSSGTFTITPNSAIVGANSDNSFLQATVSQLAVWNRALSGAEITYLYNDGAPVSYSSWPVSLID